MKGDSFPQLFVKKKEEEEEVHFPSSSSLLIFFIFIFVYKNIVKCSSIEGKFMCKIMPSVTPRSRNDVIIIVIK